MREKLAISGGEPVIKNKFEVFNKIGDEEINGVMEVMKTGMLSKFIGDWKPEFYGGDKVQELESNWNNYFKVKNSISVNSWTSGLICAVGSLDIEPQDEIIVPTWTMAATASCVLVWNAIPVFCDINPFTFNIEPKEIEKKITKKTKAIIAVDIHGMSCDIDEIMELADAYNLIVISDSAQAIGANYKEKKAGTIAHIGGYSLNRFKHIHTGEGGVIVTNNDEYAERMRLIRNHADAVSARRKIKKINNLIGFNFRMGEIEAAIAIEQLKKLDKIVLSRKKVAFKITDGIKSLNGIKTPFVPVDRDHIYYIYPILIDEWKIGVSAKKLCKALNAEGVSIGSNYINVHTYPTYSERIAYGNSHYPWVSDSSESQILYKKGDCPVAEGFNEKGFLSMQLCSFEYHEKDIELVIDSFHKVWNNLDQLK